MADKKIRIIDWIMKVPSVSARPLLARLTGLKKTTVALVLIIVAVPALLFLYGFVQMVGTQKVYCLNCHVNQRNLAFWQRSKVHPDQACARCHDTKDTTSYSSPAFHFNFSAKDDVVSGHCVGCHKDDLDKPVGYDAKKKAGPLNGLIRIPHAKHIKELGIKCTYCHYNVFHDRRPAKYATWRPTMETCYTCHDEKTTACGSCHPAGLPNAVSITGKVGGGNLSYMTMGAGEAAFSHKRHAAQGMACGSCHTNIFEMRQSHGKMTMDAMYGGKYCGHCHNGKGAFAMDACGRCHAGGAHGGGNIAYPGGGVGKVVFSHDAHTGMGMKCGDCHTRLFSYRKSAGRLKMAALYGGKACGSCHNGKRAFASTDCNRCHAGGPKPGQDIEYPGGGFGKLTFSHEAHTGMGFKCGDCHTMLFAYRKTAGHMTMDDMKAGKSCGGCHNGKKAFDVHECAKCHHMGEQ